MLQLRPTFSESWYRVAALKPKLRAGAQISRQFYRGDRWYVVRDPAGNQFHRLSDPAYRFVGLLNGKRSVEQAWDLVGGQLEDDAPTQPEVIQILSQLYSANLLETDITPDATVLLRRHKKMVERKLQGRLMNVLFPRWGFWDPDKFLKHWLPVMQTLFSWAGAVVWLLVVGLALSLVLPDWTRLKAATEHAFDLQGNWENLFWLYGVFVFVKVIHELGHAFACRRFGGECHELGVMLLVFMPCPYVDASTAWGFPSKWQRIFVGSAGMIVELFFASFCGIAWHFVDDAAYPILSQLLYNALFIASVSTLIFNANPLLRYDGYYILSDALEIPNLRQKSTEYALGLIKRHIFRVKATQPLPPWGQRIWLFLYAVASSIYRVFIGIMIVVLVAFKVPILGVLMAIGGAVTWAVVPVYKVTKYLLLDPELHRKRTRAMLFSGAVAAALVLGFGVIKFPRHVEFNGVVLPANPVTDGRQISGMLTTRGAGRLVEILAQDHQYVEKGQLLVHLEDPELTCKAREDQAELNAALARATRDAFTDLNAFQADQAYAKAYREALERDEKQLAELDVRAPFAGVLIAPKIEQFQDNLIPRGTTLGQVAVLDKLEVRGNIEQTDYELLFNNKATTEALKPEIRLVSNQARILKGGELTPLPAATDQLAHPAIGTPGGGTIQVDPRDPHGRRARQPELEVRIQLPNDTRITPGQRAYVRVTIDRTPYLYEWTRRFLQLISSHDTGKWL